MSIKYFVQMVASGIAALQSHKHSLDDIRPDALIIRGIEPVDTIVSRTGPFLLVKLIKIYFFILQFMLTPSFVESILKKWSGVFEGQFIGGKGMQTQCNKCYIFFLFEGFPKIV